MSTEQPSRQEVNKLLDFFTEPGKGEVYLKDLEDDLVALITKSETLARIDELGSVQLEYNHLLAQTFRDGQAMTVQERYDHLQAQLTSNNSKE